MINLRRLRAFIRILPAEGLELGRLWWSLALTDIRLKVFSLRLNRSILFPEESETFSTPQPRSAKKIFRFLRLTSIAANHPLYFDMSCLRRAIVLHDRLRSINIPTKLVYGVKKNPKDSSILAHSWLEAGNLRIDINSQGIEAIKAPENRLESYSTFTS